MMVDFQSITDQWIKTHGVRYFNELTNTVLLAEEVGELSRYMARVFGEQSFKKNEEEENAKEKIKEEMADVLFVLCCLANQMDINLETAFKQKLLIKTERDKERHLNNLKLK